MVGELIIIDVPSSDFTSDWPRRLVLLQAAYDHSGFNLQKPSSTSSYQQTLVGAISVAGTELWLDALHEWINSTSPTDQTHLFTTYHEFIAHDIHTTQLRMDGALQPTSRPSPSSLQLYPVAQAANLLCNTYALRQLSRRSRAPQEIPSRLALLKTSFLCDSQALHCLSLSASPSRLQPASPYRRLSGHPASRLTDRTIPKPSTPDRQTVPPLLQIGFTVARSPR